MILSLTTLNFLTNTLTALDLLVNTSTLKTVPKTYFMLLSFIMHSQPGHFFISSIFLLNSAKVRFMPSCFIIFIIFGILSSYLFDFEKIFCRFVLMLSFPVRNYVFLPYIHDP